MGKMAIKLNRLFDQALKEKVISFDAIAEAKERARENQKSMKSFKELAQEHGDPTYALYVAVLNMMSVFAEECLGLPPLHQIYDFSAKCQDLYRPGFPPMSPITKSFFNSWMSLDAAFGEEKETIGTCFLSCAARFQLNFLEIEAAKNLCDSRMGIYEVIEDRGKLCRLRELVTNKEFDVLIQSGYKGKAGDIIYIRLVRPPVNSVDYSIGFTTPYQLLFLSKEDWISYFKRHEIREGAVGVDTRLYRHMKYGKNRLYWSEYVFYGYFNFQSDVIFLTGYPDKPETQPCHERYQSKGQNVRSSI